MNNLYILILSFAYIVLVAVSYYSKKRLDIVENRIFSLLIPVSLIGTILDFISVTMAFSGMHGVIFNLINKFYLIYLLSWISLFVLYTIAISISFEKYRKAIKIVKSIYIILFITLLLVPLNYSVNQNEFYTYGFGASIMYFISTIYVITMLICLAVNFKKIKQKKYMPIFFYIFIGTIVTIIQLTNPSILIITAMETYVTILMFFTIENPDVKMIEQLNLAKEQSEKANKAKTEFLSSMSHEIRTPLNAIVGFSQTLMEDESVPPNVKNEVKDIVTASDNLLEIVNGILDISKIEANKLEIINTEYNLNTILNELVVLTRARIGEKSLELRTYFDSSIPSVLYGDHIRIKQSILNLLTNAVKYTKEGHIDFRVMTVKKDNVCRIIISVEDTGMGIKEEKINMLFTKFERLGVEKDTTVEGTGLGLAITKKLVELMNGKIVVQSKYGKGSKFTIAIDQKIVSEKPLEVKEEKIEIETKDFTGKKILVVDDNQLNLKVATLVLKKYNVTVETANSGFECIDKIKEGNIYDLVLLDDMMPKMSGVDTLKRLKEDNTYNIPTIALTANAISGMKEKYLSEGFNDYLSKPIEKTELDRVINKFL